MLKNAWEPKGSKFWSIVCKLLLLLLNKSLCLNLFRVLRETLTKNCFSKLHTASLENIKSFIALPRNVTPYLAFLTSNKRVMLFILVAVSPLEGGKGHFSS